MAILPPRCSAKAASNGSSRAPGAPTAVLSALLPLALFSLLSLRGFTISAATSDPFVICTSRVTAPGCGAGGHRVRGPAGGWAAVRGLIRTPGAPHARPEPRVRGVAHLSSARPRAVTSRFRHVDDTGRGQVIPQGPRSGAGLGLDRGRLGAGSGLNRGRLGAGSRLNQGRPGAGSRASGVKQGASGSKGPPRPTERTIRGEHPA